MKHLLRKTIITTLLSLSSLLGTTAYGGAKEANLINNRDSLLLQGTVFETQDTSDRVDLFNGPSIKGAYKFGQTVDCDFVFEVFKGGYSPKFKCLLNGKKVKIKYYNGTNRELFGEIAAGRLLWALGLGADQNYMVQLNCRNCPKGDPWAFVDSREGIIVKELAAGKTLEAIREQYKNQFVAQRNFAFAAIEVKAKGEEISDWSWSDLKKLNKDVAPKADQDALKLLMALIQHADNAAKQNTMLCPPNSIVRDAQKNILSCTQPLLYVQDLGGTFGGGGPMIHRGGATNFEKWAKTSVWKESAACQINLIPAGSPSRSQLGSEFISVEGRNLLLSKLLKLVNTANGLEDIFRAAAMDTGGFHPEGRSASEWAQVFRMKVREIEAATCAMDQQTFLQSQAGN